MNNVFRSSGGLLTVIAVTVLISLSACGGGGGGATAPAANGNEQAQNQGCATGEKSIVFTDAKGISVESCHASPGAGWAFNTAWGYYAEVGTKFALNGNKVLLNYDTPSAVVDAEVLSDKKVTMAKSPTALFAIFKASNGFWHFKEVSTTSRTSLITTSTMMTNGSGTGLTDIRTAKVSETGLIYLDGTGICRKLEKNSAGQWDQVRIALTDC